jgi:hypothetical protein
MKRVQPSWDPEIDTPATIAVIGGGACGVEAALYARFLGYSVELFESDKVGDSLLNWADRALPGSWLTIASPLGLAALEAHGRCLPKPESIPTCAEYVGEYLLPLARCDLLHSSVNVRTEVTSISRLGCGDPDKADGDLERRAEQEFRVLLSSNQRGEFSQVVDLILDCSGAQRVRRGLATGGGLPIGWSVAENRITRGKCDFKRKKGQALLGKRILLMGNDDSAIGNAIDWSSSADEGSRLYWVTPKSLRPRKDLFDFPKEGCLLSDSELVQAENLYRKGDSASIVPMAAWGIESIRIVGEDLVVCLQIHEEETVEVCVDEIIDCGACRPSASYHHSLKIQAWSDDGVIRCEPHFYMLGDRALGSTHQVDIEHRRCGFDEFRKQIRQVFSMIGGRDDLDLYQTVKPQAWQA